MMGLLVENMVDMDDLGGYPIFKNPPKYVEMIDDD